MFLSGHVSVLGAIALCLFPLWPPVVRSGVYYISLVAAVFVGVFLSLVVSEYYPPFPSHLFAFDHESLADSFRPCLQ